MTSDARFQTWPALVAGDRVAVVAPASPIRIDMLEGGLSELRRLGFVPVVREDVSARFRFTAGDERRRLAELEAALADPTIRAVWFARGGAGTTSLLRRLDASLLARDPKPVIGESDATALGCFALRAGVAWLHGPMVASSLRQGSAAYIEESLLAHLSGRGFPRTDRPAQVRALRAGRAKGRLWGGCLSVLAALAGTPWMPRIQEGLLFLEDSGVKPYQVHRMLVQLRDAGALGGTAGVVLGDFSDCIQHVDQGYDAADVIAEFFDDIAPGAPVVIGWPAGHAAAPHLCLPMGLEAELLADDTGGALSWNSPSATSRTT